VSLGRLRHTHALAWIGSALAGVACAASAQPVADPAKPADGPVWQLQLSSDRHSDALPLAAWGDDDWSRLRPRAGTNLAYVDEQLRLQRRSGSWTLGLVARSHATLVAGSQALALAAQLDRGRPAADQPAQQWQVDMRLRGFAGAGASLALDSPADAGWARALAASTGGQWQAGVTAELLALGRLRLRRIDGTASLAGNGGGYAFDLRSDEHDDRLSAPFQQAFARRGLGLLLGGSLQWQHGDWTVRAALQDGGWLHWRGLPRQQLALDTSTVGFDADGFVQYKPLLTGQNSQRGFTQAQPWTGSLALAHDLDDRRQAGITLRQLPGAPLLPALHWRQRSGDLQWGLAWQVHQRRASIDLAWRGLALQAGADRLGAGAHSRSFGLAWQTTLP
jgi:hypothetical protein